VTVEPGKPEAVHRHEADASVMRLSTARHGHHEGAVADPADHPSGRTRVDSGPVPPFSGMPLGEIAERSGPERIDVLAWRDFDDPEAGGSEFHAHRIMTAWSDAGPDVSMTTSSVPGDGLVGIWNGLPFLSPVWSHSP